MARIERKVHYIGTWREDHVTDSTMRQIIARSHAEKGQKVKVKLSKDGLNISRTVLFQENFLWAFPLWEVYFLTVNPQHPTCLLCIVADPLKKYLILALRTASHMESSDMIHTFQSLKQQRQQPGLHQGGNVMLRRKENGNWTLRERSQHNANRHLQQVFKEAASSSSSSTSPSPPPSSSAAADPSSPRQPNGHVSSSSGGLSLSPAPFFEEEEGVGVTETGGVSGGRRRAHSASQTAGVEGGSEEEEMATMRQEVENLTQELRDLKLVLEKVGTLSPRTPRDIAPTPFPASHPDNSHDVRAEARSAGVARNGPVVSAFSEGAGYPGPRPGEARVFVDDHRQAWARPRDRAPSARPLFGKGAVQRQITVPAPANGPANGPAVPDGSFTVQRRVVREPVLQLAPADSSRKLSSTRSLWQGGGAKMAPLSARDPHHHFRSMRVSRHSGVPSTIVRSIEETYAPAAGTTLLRSQRSHRHYPVVLVQAPASLQDGAQDIYIPQPSGVVHGSRSLTPTSSLRRASSPAKVRAPQHHNGDLDDVLL